MEMKAMPLAGGGAAAAAAAASVRYRSGGRDYTYAGPGTPAFHGPCWCEWLLSSCRVCGLDHSQRQLWRASILGPTINLVKVNVGGGILAIPLTFKLCGAGPATVMLCFFGGLSHYSSVLLGCVGEMTGCATLESASNRLLGPLLGRVLQLTMLLKCFGSLVAYLIVMGNVFPPLLCGHLMVPAASSWDFDGGAANASALGAVAALDVAAAAAAAGVRESSRGGCTLGYFGGLEMRTALLCAIATFVLAPLSMLRSVNSLRFGSALCLVLVALLILELLSTASSTASSATEDDGGLSRYSAWIHGGVQQDDYMEAVLRSLGILTFAFTCQHLVFPVYSELDGASTALFSLVSRLTFVSVALIYWAMGAAGSLSFGAHTHADVLQNMGGDAPSTYINLLKVGFTSTLVFSYQFNIFAARPSLDALLFTSRTEGAASLSLCPASSSPSSFRRFVLEGWACVLASTLTAIFVPSLDLALALTGSSTCTIIAFLYPAALYIAAVRNVEELDLHKSHSAVSAGE